MKHVKKYKGLMFLFVGLFVSCNDTISWNLEEDHEYDGQDRDTIGFFFPHIDAPQVNTGVVQNITTTGCVVSGEIIKTGTNGVLDYGHCWSMNPIPDTTDDFNSLGATQNMLVYNSSVGNLNPNTNYYVRAYAKSEFGVSYGSQVSFKTSSRRCGYIDCESLSEFNYEAYGSSSLAKWQVGSGYQGNGFICPNSTGGKLSFNTNYGSDVVMTLWLESWEAGFWKNRLPAIFVDGVELDISIVQGENNADWVQIETNSIISSGNHTVEIEFSPIGTFRTYKVDEIEFWCQ